jgi:hypothetical protein
MSLLPVGFGASGDDYEITDSLRLRSSASAYLSRTFPSAGNRRTWTWSGWVKRGKLSDYQALFCGGDATSNNDAWLRLRAASGNLDAIEFRNITGGSYTANVYTSAVFRDPSAWYHIVIVIDTTQATSTNRIKIYVNSEQQTLTFASTPAQNADMSINAAGLHTISKLNFASSSYLDAYLTEVNFIDGQALTADDFGEYDANGTWKAKNYTGTYGTNGFYLPMKPTTQADGFNTVLYTGQGSNAPQSINGYGFTPDLVWIKSRVTGYGHALFDSIRGPNARLQSDTTGAEAVSGTYLTSLDSDGFTLAADYGQNAPNEPYVAWGWDAGDNQTSTGISSVTYTGTGVAQSIKGFGFNPDLVWIKNRSNAASHIQVDSVRGIGKELSSNSTGVETSNGTTRFASFDSDGFTFASTAASSLNASGNTYVAWGWDAGDGDPVSNTDGSITSTVKANPATGFSIVSYTGTGVNTTVGHGLGAAPKMVICKARSDTGDWQVYHAGVGATKLTRLNLTNATVTNAIWQNTAPTSTVFSVGASPSINKNGETNVAYCFSEVSGVSKFGSYTGNGSTTGPVITTGFRPGFLLVKKTSGSAAWQLIDGTRDPFANPASQVLYPNLSDAEYTWSGGAWNFTSTGFQPTRSDTDFNGNGETYIYMAFKGSYSDYVSPLNDTGTITTRVKANDTYGFSIASYVGTGANATIGHGLSAAPDLAIFKNRDDGNDDWWTYNSISGATKFLRLNTTAAIGTSSVVFNDTEPTSTVFSIGTGSAINTNGDNHIAYFFRSVAGYSKIGSYTGNGSTTGPVVTTGFRPAFVMTKRTDSSGNWYINDGTRSPSNPTVPLYADLSNGEGGNGIDLLSNGFQIKNADSSQNASGGTYIYMAFADTADARFNFDASGNKNNWLPNNINSNAESETTYDLMKDTPSLVDENAANFATLNPLNVYPGRQFAVDGNLKWNDTSGGSWGRSTVSVTTGKWYWEVSGFTTTNWFIGVSDGTKSITNYYAYYVGAPTALVYLINGNTYIAGANAAFISPIATTAVVGFVVDADAGSLAVYKNGALQGTITGLNYGSYSPMVAPPAAGSCVYNFGQRPFAYTPPTGSKKLNTFNLPDSTIENGSDYFNTVLYSGNSSTQSITGVGFQPNFVWIKPRNAVGSHILQDTVRGNTKFLESNSNGAEQTNSSTGLLSFDSDGFTVGSGNDWNNSGETFVAWDWKANGSGVSNTDGSVTSTVSANTTAGFSIVSYAGNNGSNQTVGHGLGTTPSMFIIKNRTSAASWAVYHKDISSPLSNAMYLNSTNAAFGWAYWGTGGLSSTVFPVHYGSADVTNQSGKNYIAYVFAEVEGYSAFGSYTGNGSTDGTFVYTGFRPAWIMVKRYTATGNWQMFDSSRDLYNPENGRLYANLTDAENDQNSVDFVSNGFKLRDTSGDNNSSGQSYIYMAFAENPFKNANAR